MNNGLLSYIKKIIEKNQLLVIQIMLVEYKDRTINPDEEYEYLTDHNNLKIINKKRKCEK